MVGSTFALKQFASQISEIVAGNHWVPQYLRIPVDSSFEKCLKENMQNMRNSVGSIYLLGMQHFVNLILMLPFGLAKTTFNIMTSKLTMMYSNMPSPSVNYNFKTAKCNSMTVFLPACGDLLCGLIAISHGKIMKLGLITDKAFIDNPDEFMGLLQKYS
jgi:hypothetical protein